MGCRVSLPRQMQWFYWCPPTLEDDPKTQGSFRPSFGGAGWFFAPCVAVAEATSLARHVWEGAIRGWLCFGIPLLCPASLLLSQHLGGLKPAFCNCSNKLLLFPKGFLPALFVS